MFMISKEFVGSVIATKEKLVNSEKRKECIADIENMIEIKQAHLWRADAGSCCVNICSLVPQLETEIGILQEALDALKVDDNNKTTSLMEGYLAFLRENYEIEHQNYL